MGGRKLSPEDFIARSILVHGNKYDYSKVEYKATKLKVEIICEQHGSFFQKPSNHIHLKQGCRACTAGRTEETKEKMRKTWKKKVAKGYKPPCPFTKESSSKARAAYAALPEEVRKAVSTKAGDTKRGRPQRMETQMGKHSNNVHGKYWHFINRTLGAELKGRNLSQLVRDNVDLFDPKDVIWTKGHYCNATLALRHLNPRSKKRTQGKIRSKIPGSWKDWVLG